MRMILLLAMMLGSIVEAAARTLDRMSVSAAVHL